MYGHSRQPADEMLFRVLDFEPADEAALGEHEEVRGGGGTHVFHHRAGAPGEIGRRGDLRRAFGMQPTTLRPGNAVRASAI